MTNVFTRPLRLALCLALPLSVWAQTPEATGVVTTAAPAPLLEGCRPLTDKAMLADMKAVTAQSQKRDVAEQARLFDESVALWTQAVAQCEGRAKDRAQRNLADNQKTGTQLAEQLDSGPQCAAAHKDAGALQDIARQALSERRWSDASMLFRKAENIWDLAAERCTGSQQEVAVRRRDQSELDGQNAEFCAPLFEKAREHTQKLRASATGMTREDKQDASMVAETLWRDALGQCKGSAVQDLARNNAQALARERGTPWVARIAPAPQPGVSKGGAPAAIAATPKATDASVAAPAGAVTTLKSAFSSLGTPLPVTVPAPLATKPGEFSAGTTRFSGQFAPDPDGATYSGTGKVVWASGDVWEGPLVKGQRHGKGLFVWANGQRYEGDWLNDQPTGQARVQFFNGNHYEGSVLQSVPQGQGRMRFASGDTYVGKFQAGEPDGNGLYVWKNGQQFEGSWKNGRPHGQGKLQFAAGNLFEGRVLDGVPSGQGRMVFATGEIYEGEFVNGQHHGEGTFTWPSGDQYSGQWKAGKKHGPGTFTWKSGDVWQGLYEEDVQTNPNQLAGKN